MAAQGSRRLTPKRCSILGAAFTLPGLAVLAALAAPAPAVMAQDAAALDTTVATPPPRSADWIRQLPKGETRRKMVLGCTPCHPIGLPRAFRSTAAEWEEIVKRMKKIDDDLDLALIPFQPGELEAWIARYSKMPARGRDAKLAKAEIREYPAGKGTGFYHDMALAGGKAWIADYFGNVLYGVDPETGKVEQHPIPVTVAAPGKPAGAHALDVTRDGILWITFTKSEEVARFDPETRQFRMYRGFESGGNVQYFVLDAERFIHQDAQGGIYTSHFSKEILSRLDPETGEVKTFRAKRTERLPEKSVHLYAAVADSQGRLWYTETHGNRLGYLDPRSGESEEWDVFEPWSGPKRLAIDPDDRLWIPHLTTGRVTVYDTKQRKVLRRLTVPIEGDFIYGIRRNPHTGDLWLTGSGSDSAYRIDPKTYRIKVYRFPSRGAYTRTFAFEPNGDVWTCYGSFPNAHTQTSHPDFGTVVRIRPLD